MRTRAFNSIGSMGFRRKVVDAAFDAVDAQRTLVCPRDHDDRNQQMFEVRADFAHQLEPVHAGHDEVDERDIEFELFQLFCHGDRIGECDSFATIDLLDKAAQEERICGIVVDDQGFHACIPAEVLVNMTP